VLSRQQATGESTAKYDAARASFEKKIDGHLGKGQHTFKVRSNSTIETEVLEKLLGDYTKGRGGWTINIVKPDNEWKTGWYELTFS
jgi:hypothetical protein